MEGLRGQTGGILEPLHPWLTRTLVYHAKAGTKTPQCTEVAKWPDGKEVVSLRDETREQPEKAQDDKTWM